MFCESGIAYMWISLYSTDGLGITVNQILVPVNLVLDKFSEQIIGK